MFVKPFRHYQLTFLLFALVIGAVLAPSASPAHAGDGWSGAQRITSSQSLFPDITTDSQGVHHLVYTETSDFTSRSVRYRNDRGGQWNDSVLLSTPGTIADLARLSTVTVNGQVLVGVVYKARVGNNNNTRIYYRLSTDGGANWGPQEQLTSVTSFEPALSLDSTGQPHAIFSQGNPDALELAYTTKVNGSWTSPVVIGDSTSNWERDTTISYTVSNGQITLHVLYTGRTGNGDGTKQIYYTRKIGSGGWSTPVQRQSNGGGGFAKLVTDFSSSIYGAWQMNSSSYGVEVFTEQSSDNGASWTNARAVGSLNSNIAQTPAIARTFSGALAIAWEDGTSSNDKTRDIEARVSTDNGATWSKVLNVSPADGFSRNPAMTGDGSGFKLVWHDNRSGSYQIYYSAYGVGPTEPTAQPVISTPSINTRTVSVSFTNVGGNPTQIRWRWGAAPTDAASDSNGWQTFSNPKSIALPSNVTGACENLVLYTQVRNSGATQTTPSTAAVLYDTAVQANIRVTNPFLAGLPTTFTQNVQDTYNSTSDGAYNGNPDYTRMPQFFLGIYNNNDCSGLSGYAVPVSNSSGPINNGTYENKLTLSQGSLPSAGSKVTVNVVVTDKLGNITIVPKQLIYDPANTAQSGTPNTDGLPTLNSNTAPTANSENSIIRTLSFQNVDVDDTAYGKFENLPAGSQFWGVWIANSRTPVTNPNSSSLQWFPVEVANPGPSFSVGWNLFNGIAPANRGPGAYYIYVKFLDGAGNATVGTLPALQVNLAQGYSVPKIFLPEVRK